MTSPPAPDAPGYDDSKALRHALSSRDADPEAPRPAPPAPPRPPSWWRRAIKAVLRWTVRPVLIRLRQFFIAPIVENTDRTQELAGALTRSHAAHQQTLEALQAEVVRLAQLLDAMQSRQRAVADGLELVRHRAERLAERNAYVLGEDLLARTPYGYVLAPLEDVPFVALLVEGAGWEPTTNKLLERLLEPGDVYVDVGANVGTLLLSGARRVGVNGRVFAFEPIPRLHALLRQTVAINGLGDRCEVIQVAAGRADGSQPLHVPEIYGHASLYQLPDTDAVRTIEVAVQPLDNLIPATAQPTVIKIDVEGAELDVLAGMDRLLREGPPPVLIVEYGTEHLTRSGHRPADWFAAFAEHGYRRFVIDESSGSCAPADDLAPDQFATCNIVFVQADSALLARVTG